MPSLQVLAFAIFTVIVKQPAYYYERPDVCVKLGCRSEAPQAREKRLKGTSLVMARAILEPRYGMSPWQQAAVLLSQGQSETHWARYVGLGRCSDPPYKLAPRCDPDRKGIPQSHTYFQLKERVCPAAWNEVQGSEAELFEASRCVIRAYAGSMTRCRGRHPQGDVAGAFSGLACGIVCSWSGGVKRARRYHLALLQLANQ